MTIDSEKIKRLKALFPSVFTETLNEKGNLIESIDFEKLKADLGTFSDLFEGRKERYGMDWPGKKECLKIIQQPSLATLKPFREESVNFDTTENLFIEGDNLEVLKLLQKSYFGKVKMIYIDPPYNTGKEFIYPDNFAESLDTYLAYAGFVDDKGKKFSTNTANEGRFHTKWLNMMYSRLYLARNLLREDGTIFISIDDNEMVNLRKLCDMVFGEENFIGNFIWKSRQIVDSRNQSNASIDHEYIVVYSKRSETSALRGKDIDLSKYTNPDNDPRGAWMSNSILGLANASQRPNLHFKIEDPKTGWKFAPPQDSGWRYSHQTLQEKIKDNRIIFPKKQDGRPREKKFLSELSSNQTGFSSVLAEDVGYTLNGSREVRSLLEGKFFDFPKPISLLKILIEQGATGKDDIILDFFSGSSTTAHAVLDMNKEDAGNRKFIMVQLPEPCAPESDAYKAGYTTIADIGKERIRRVINKIKQEMGDQPNLDLGFKVLKLDKSNFKIWEPTSQITINELLLKLEGHIPHIDPKASQEDILYELLLKSGYLPTAKIEKQQIAGKTVYSIGDGVLMICLESEITREFIEAVAATDPERFICLDHAFKGNDQLKANAMHAFSSRRSGGNQDVFRTI